MVLSEGPENGAYWEHAWAAEQLGVPLVRPDELHLKGDHLVHGGRRVDGVYRRTDADLLRTEVGALLGPAIRAGTVGVVNAFGAGVGDDKLTHAYVEDMIRFYLGQEPLVRSVQTFDLARPRPPRAGARPLRRARDQAARRPRRHRRARLPARRARRRSTRCASACAPTRRQWVAQPMVELSTHATLIDGALAQRHVDLRPFVFMHGPDRPRVMPGGLTRFARDEGQMVVNSIQNGGFKDTWVLDR